MQTNGPDYRKRDARRLAEARVAVGLSAEPFQDFGKAAEHGEPIVCECIHCGKLFASASPDLADVERICRGDCGCQSKR